MWCSECTWRTLACARADASFGPVDELQGAQVAAKVSRHWLCHRPTWLGDDRANVYSNWSPSIVG
jgi:hypothetical protein